jgi:hypothetical protein
MSKEQIAMIKSNEMNSKAAKWSTVEDELSKIHVIPNHRVLSERLISAVQVATTDISDVHSTDRHSKVGPKELPRKWNIGLQAAKETLEVTTQKGIRTATQPMSRRVRVDHLDLHRPRLRGTWYVDTLILRVKS